ncbi:MULTISPECIES: hypothetical protein [unclassified Streptomyces]|uniref:hypothetical protein n=1 Tax=unclassified Streptomyces TaxID=2593676 RepID=UPI0036E524F9
MPRPRQSTPFGNQRVVPRPARSRARLVTKTANELADQLLDMNPLDWLWTVLG